MSFGSKKNTETPSEETHLENPITYYKSRTGFYPANSQIWWAMKRPPEMGTDRPPKQYLEVFDPSLRYQVYTGNTPASRGHYILKAYKKDRSTVSGVAGLAVETTGGKRPEAVAFYAGRVFYGGVFTSGWNTEVIFTQILEKPEQVSACYQQQDPTSEDLRDLLPSDGGVITIPEVTRVFSMRPIGRDLFVFGSNGVWMIGGGGGIAFAANDFSVTKLSGTPTISRLSFVDVEGYPIWWNRSGINTIIPQDQQPQVVSLTDSTIKEFYDQIPEQSKHYAKGAYDALTQTVQFLYRSTATSVDADLFDYDKILYLDTRSGAWSPWDIPDTRIGVHGIFAVEGQAVSQTIVPVVDVAHIVITGTDNVVATKTERQIVQSKIKYIVNVTQDTGNNILIPAT